MGFENIRTVVTRSNLLTLAILCYVLIPNIDFADGRRLHKFGKRKGTIKTIESDDGDVIDCVDIYKQPAFDHPLLKNHTIESDGYRNTGCYNLDCPGFVQVSRMAAIGSKLNPISTYDGKQNVINVVLNQHKESGQWWVQYQNEPIGYWPNSIFTTLKNGADLLSWGGEIVNNGITHHSETQMGSGHFPAEGFGRASFFSNIGYFDGSGFINDPEKLTPFASKPSCYDVKVAADKADLGTHFFYGGPGYSDKCPT
ncbi:protein neprosin-like [Humulus lupulus]|uniref:protein neprosin-like n=1 Tax=Humulus lupulus TaxID=3486 RepID=UPI002B4128A4|nr:protein neprosin-like [Humulus lupulus]